MNSNLWRAEVFRIQTKTSRQKFGLADQSVLYAAAHLTTLPHVAQTEAAGRLTEAMQGEVKRGSAYGDRFQGWNLTVWGQQYLALRQQRAAVSFVVR